MHPENSEATCDLCFPRLPNNEYRREIARLQFSSLYLYTDQRFRGYCLLIFDRYHAIAIDDLTPDEYFGFLFDLRQAVTAVRSAMSPDHINLELLGNTTPHLHWHIVPRYKSDPRWGRPIWEDWPRNEFNINRVTLPEAEMHQIITAIQTQLIHIAQENRP